MCDDLHNSSISHILDQKEKIHHLSPSIVFIIIPQTNTSLHRNSSYSESESMLPIAFKPLGLCITHITH